MSAVANMHSANLHPEVITGYLHREISLGRMLGPFPPTFAAPELQLNRFGVIPKGHNSGKWRLIPDLSFPPGKSVNDGVDPTLCSLTYTTVDQVAEIIANLGGAALMAKVDIESAYRLVPVHPHDCALQALQWQGQIYVDPMLPFGLRSAPKIFNAVADAFHWHLKQRGINRVLHYLDDFIIVAPPKSKNVKRTSPRSYGLRVPLASQSLARRRKVQRHPSTPPLVQQVLESLEFVSGEAQFPCHGIHLDPQEYEDNLFEDISCYTKKAYKTEEFDARFKTFQMCKPRQKIEYIQEYTICNPYHLKQDLSALNKQAIRIQEDFNINPRYSTVTKAVEILMRQVQDEYGGED